MEGKVKRGFLSRGRRRGAFSPYIGEGTIRKKEKRRTATMKGLSKKGGPSAKTGKGTMTQKKLFGRQ